MKLHVNICPLCCESNLIKDGDLFRCKVCGSTLTPETMEGLEETLQKLMDQGKSCDLGNMRRLLRDRLAAEHVSWQTVAEAASDILRAIPDDFQAGFFYAYANRKSHRNEYVFFLKSRANDQLSDYVKKLVYPYLIDGCDANSLIIGAVREFLICQGDYKKEEKRLDEALRQRDKENSYFADMERELFICHAHSDIEKILPLIKYLEDVEALNCWYSERNLPKDCDNYKEEIERAIRNCKAFVAFLSYDCAHSEDVKWELTIAKDLGKPIRIEYRLEDIPNPHHFKSFFDGIQWIDGFNASRANEIAEKFARAIETTSKPAKPAPSPTPARSAGPNLEINRIRLMILNEEYSEASAEIDKLLAADIQNPELWKLKLDAVLEGSEEPNGKAAKALKMLLACAGSKANEYKKEYAFILEQPKPKPVPAPAPKPTPAPKVEPKPAAPVLKPAPSPKKAEAPAPKPASSPAAKPSATKPKAKPAPESNPLPKQKPILSPDGKTVTYGLYPQTVVSDRALIAKLETAPKSKINGWYLCDGKYYAKATVKPYGVDYKFSDGTLVQKGDVRWFACEPIKWRVLLKLNHSYNLLSEAVLDARRFDKKTLNYTQSEIRDWLNGKFLSAAFCCGDSAIEYDQVSNSAYDSGVFASDYMLVPDSFDRLYLLSYSEVTNTGYGFPSNEGESNTRIAKPTDYALAMGATRYWRNGACDWWLRSQPPVHTSSARFIYMDGHISYNRVELTQYGVRPAMRIII